jgi:hypothetical protein
VNFVDKKNVVFLEVCDYRGKIPGFFYDRPGRYFYINTQFIGYYMRQRGLSKPRRPVKEDMLRGFLAALCRVYEYFKFFLDAAKGRCNPLKASAAGIFRPENPLFRVPDRQCVPLYFFLSRHITGFFIFYFPSLFRASLIITSLSVFPPAAMTACLKASLDFW